MGYLVGRFDPPDGRAYHGAFGQQRSGAAAETGADSGGDDSHLQGRRPAGRDPHALRGHCRAAQGQRHQREDRRPRQRAFGLQVRRIRTQGRSGASGDGTS